MAQRGYRSYGYCGVAPLTTGSVPLFCGLRNGAAFDGNGENLLRNVILFLRALALVRAVGVRGMREVLVFVREVIEQERRRVVGEGNGRDQGRVTDDLRDLGRWRQIAVA